MFQFKNLKIQKKLTLSIQEGLYYAGITDVHISRVHINKDKTYAKAYFTPGTNSYTSRVQSATHAVNQYIRDTTSMHCKLRFYPDQAPLIDYDAL